MPALEVSSVVAFPTHLMIDENNRRLTGHDFDSLLNHPQVMMRDRNSVEKKLRAMMDDGKENLMVVSDFDYTLSKFEDTQGRRCWTTHGVFDNCVKQIDEDLAVKFQLLKDKYFPIEFDPNLTIEEKVPFMEEWWNISHQYIVSAKFHRATVEGFVRNAHIMLRDQTDQMIIQLDRLDVPLVVFSAGIGNIIEMYLKQELGEIPKNIHLISNMMNFDEQDIVVSFSEPLIHTFCKNSSVIRKEAEFFHIFRERRNVVLLGDSMGDIHMDVGVEKKALTLKIGFLNSNVNSLLDHYMEVYDVVLVQDQSMQIPHKILQAIANGHVKN
ncbi:HAD hydrolase, family IE [Dictyocaulus viviparus]|uniref:5'-nucleotidase n=1 Tax=Dictyocaulus viviparus TaxID=29172 RepID=A0A0D8XE77_DICVI|nr:HAD hydrolase, family IE [Dictyocaulus viviparus]